MSPNNQSNEGQQKNNNKHTCIECNKTIIITHLVNYGKLLQPIAQICYDYIRPKKYEERIVAISKKIYVKGGVKAQKSKNKFAYSINDGEKKEFLSYNYLKKLTFNPYPNIGEIDKTFKIPLTCTVYRYNIHGKWQEGKSFYYNVPPSLWYAHHLENSSEYAEKFPFKVEFYGNIKTIHLNKKYTVGEAIYFICKEHKLTFRPYITLATSESKELHLHQSLDFYHLDDESVLKILEPIDFL